MERANREINYLSGRRNGNPAAILCSMIRATYRSRLIFGGLMSTIFLNSSALALNPPIAKRLPESTVLGWRLCQKIQEGINLLPLDTSLNTWPNKLRVFDVKPVKWIALDPIPHMALIKQEFLKVFDYAHNISDAEKEHWWLSEEALILRDIRSKIIKFDMANTDINGDQRSTIIYRITKREHLLGTIGNYKIGPQRFVGWNYIIHQTDIDPSISDLAFKYSAYLNWSAFNYKNRTWFLEMESNHAYLATFYTNSLHELQFSSECDLSLRN